MWLAEAPLSTRTRRGLLTNIARFMVQASTFKRHIYYARPCEKGTHVPQCTPYKVPHGAAFPSTWLEPLPGRVLRRSLLVWSQTWYSYLVVFLLFKTFILHSYVQLHSRNYCSSFLTARAELHRVMSHDLRIRYPVR